MDYYTDPIRRQTDQARAGSTPHIVRYVLGISLALAILALSAIWITGALNAPQGDRTSAVTNQSVPRT